VNLVAVVRLLHPVALEDLGVGVAARGDPASLADAELERIEP
jgi:hypothetical protein